MTTVKDIYEYINSFAPFDTQESWDNSGMLVGDFGSQVKTAVVCLDITNAVVKKAAGAGADLIISRHPVIFDPLSQVHSGDVVFELIRHGMSAVCAHTNLDLADGGVNDVLIELLGLKDVRVVPTDEGFGCLKVGSVQSLAPEELAELTAGRLHTTVRFASGGKAVKTVAVCSGGGCSFLDDVKAAGIDALVTGDAKHNNFADAENAGVTLIAAGHHETENPAMPVLAERLKRKFSDIQVVYMDSQPVKYINSEE